MQNGPIQLDKRHQWWGDTVCDLCSTSVVAPCFDYFVDGATIYGPWALMCERCFKQYGTYLGIAYDVKNKHKISISGGINDVVISEALCSARNR